MNEIYDPNEDLDTPPLDEKTLRIKAELDHIKMTLDVLEWLERVTQSNEGKNLFFELERSLLDSVQRAYDGWNEPEEEKQPSWRNRPGLPPDKVYCYSLKFIHAEVWETIRKAVAYVADGAQKPDPVEMMKLLAEGMSRVAEGMSRVEDAQEEHGDILKTLAGNRERTKEKQRKAGKRAYKETRKERDDRARKEQAEAFKMCERIFKTMSDNGKTFAKKDAVFEYVIKELNLDLTPGSLRTYYYAELRKRKQNKKGTPSCK